jgi:hypothetical protein
MLKEGYDNDDDVDDEGEPLCGPCYSNTEY